MKRLILAAGFCLLCLAGTASADTVDDFTLAQGPITLGPGEEPSEQEATMFAPGVLGDFRIMTPAVDEEAPAGAMATAEIGGGSFDCSVVISGGCATAWADEVDNVTFDFTASEAIEFDILEAAPGAVIGVFLFDANVDIGQVIGGAAPDGVLAFLENPAPGSYSLSLDEFFNPLNPFATFDFSQVRNVVLVAGFGEAADGTIRIGPVTTAGPIGDGPIVEPPAEVTVDQVSGTYFNADRDGEGCQVTLEGDGTTVVLTCYIYQGGEQAWIIGAGVFEDGEIDFDPMTITSGADFGDDFSAGNVNRSRWGSAGMVWQNCNDATLTFAPELAGFLPVVIDVTKVTRSDCGDGAPDPSVLLNQGTLFNPDRDGEGLQLAVQGESNIYVLTWYTYLEGAQVWLVGTGVQTGNRIEFDDLVITRGTDFGPLFVPGDVVRESWGSLVLEYTDCNNAMATITPLASQNAFDAFEVAVRKLVTGTCP